MKHQNYLFIGLFYLYVSTLIEFVAFNGQNYIYVLTHTTGAAIIGFILYTLGSRYLVRYYYYAGGDRFAALGLIMLLSLMLPAFFDGYAKIFTKYYISAKDLFYLISHAQITLMQLITGFLANFVLGLVYSVVIGVILFVFRFEFVPSSERLAYWANLDIPERRLYRDSSMITVVYYVLLILFFGYHSLSFMVIPCLLLLLVCRVIPTVVSALFLLGFIGYFEYINYYADMPIVAYLVGQHNILIHNGIKRLAGELYRSNNAVFLLFVPFYLLEMAKKYTETTQGKQIQQEHRQERQAVDNSSNACTDSIYIGKRIG